jgi:hypothetical protein
MEDEPVRKRRSRVLEYFKQRQEQEPEDSGDEQPFRGLDTEFGLDNLTARDSK